MTPALALDTVSFRIGGAVLTDDVSLAVHPGDRVALIGPNGAGKTTLMHLVAGVYRPSAGRILLHGTDVTRWSIHRRARAGLARTFQITNLVPSLTVDANIALAVGASASGTAHPVRPWRRDHRVWATVDELLERSGIGAIRTQRVGSLPYGDQRKLEIVVALARDARLVLLDEPGAGLTLHEAESLIELVFGLGEELAVVFVDHDLDLVRQLANRMSLLDLGRIVAEGSVDAVTGSEEFARIYLEGGLRAGRQ